eukprot:gene22972-27787_t
MTKFVDFFFETPQGVILCRPIPWRVRGKRCQVLHKDISDAFGLNPDDGLAVAKLASKKYVCDKEVYRVDPEWGYSVIGCLIDTEDEPEDASPKTPSATFAASESEDEPEITGEAASTFVNLCDSEPADTFEPELGTPVANLSKQDFEFANAFPKDTIFTTQVPSNVDGNITFGFHLKQPPSKDKRGFSLTKLPFFQTPRTWSHANNGSDKAITDNWKQLGARVNIRSVKCLGEAVCKNETCPFLQIHGKSFIEKAVQDVRALEYVIRGSKSSTYVPSNKDPHVEIGQVRQRLQELGLRAFLFEIKYFICPLDIPWSPAKVMLLMDRVFGKPPFKGQLAYSDGMHKTMRDKVVEKICCVIPTLGLIKLVVDPFLPAGERGMDARAMWAAVEYAVATYAKEHPEEFAAYLDAKNWLESGGQIHFRPGGFVRDAAGGAWNGLRMNYNFLIVDIESRKGFRVRDAQGNSLEIDCDLHVGKDVSLHCKKIDNEFDANTFDKLWHDWWKELAPGQLLDARARLMDFIEDQPRKDDNRNLGKHLTVSESVRMELCSFVDQSSHLKHMGECGYVRRESRVQELYQERRANLAAEKRARTTADDIMEEEPTPKIVNCKRTAKKETEVFIFKVDPDPSDDSLDGYWKTAKNDTDVVFVFLSAVQTHSPDKEGLRNSVLTLKTVRYISKGTKKLAGTLTKLFKEPAKLSVLSVPAPTQILGVNDENFGVHARTFK